MTSKKAKKIYGAFTISYYLCNFCHPAPLGHT